MVQWYKPQLAKREIRVSQPSLPQDIGWYNHWNMYEFDCWVSLPATQLRYTIRHSYTVTNCTATPTTTADCPAALVLPWAMATSHQPHFNNARPGWLNVSDKTGDMRFTYSPQENRLYKQMPLPMRYDSHKNDTVESCKINTNHAGISTTMLSCCLALAMHFGNLKG